MSARYSTWIRIGGSIKRSNIEPLLKVIAKAYVSLEWGEWNSSVVDLNAVFCGMKVLVDGRECP